MGVSELKPEVFSRAPVTECLAGGTELRYILPLKRHLPEVRELLQSLVPPCGDGEDTHRKTTVPLSVRGLCSIPAALRDVPHPSCWETAA